MKTFINSKPFTFYSHYGTTFKCKYCDFSDIVYVTNPNTITVKQLMIDVSEMISFHRAEIWTNLNGFSGYDTIRYELTFTASYLF